MLYGLISWWYGRGLVDAWRGVLSGVVKVDHIFAVPVLLRTLFSPWKQIVSYPGRSLQEKFQAAIDNLISRIIGFFTRLLALLVAAIFVLAALIAGLAAAIIWPFVPPLIVLMVIRSIVG